MINTDSKEKTEKLINSISWKGTIKNITFASLAGTGFVAPNLFVIDEQPLSDSLFYIIIGCIFYLLIPISLIMRKILASFYLLFYHDYETYEKIARRPEAKQNCRINRLIDTHVAFFSGNFSGCLLLYDENKKLNRKKKGVPELLDRYKMLSLFFVGKINDASNFAKTVQWKSSFDNHISAFISFYAAGDYENARTELFGFCGINRDFSKKTEKDKIITESDDIITAYMLMMCSQMLKQEDEAARYANYIKSKDTKSFFAKMVG